MKELIIPTNMHCGSCVTKLGKVLNSEPGVHHWSADVVDPKKRVTIHGDITMEQALGLIQKAGFKGNDEPVVECDMPAAKEIAPQTSFWKDYSVWKKASANTLNCLIGCSIGDFGMIIYLQAFHPQMSMWLQMFLAIIAGLLTSITLETILLHVKEKLVWQKAFQMALSMSLISMIGMEIAMNATDFMITGGKAQLSTLSYWVAFIPAAVVGFLAPLPYNYFQLKKHNKACH
jgi:cation transport ATPase